MELYVSILIVLAALSLLSRVIPWRLWDWLAVALLVLIAGLRVNTGFDIQNYQLIYNGVVTQGQVEFGFLRIIQLFNLLGLPFAFFVFMWSLFSISFLYYFITRYFRLGIVPLMYYYCRFFFLRDMGQIRSSLAASICLMSVTTIQKKQPVKFLVIILIASTIHSAALFFALVYPFVQVMRNHLTMSNTLLSFLIFFFVGELIMPFVLSLVAHFLPRYAPYIVNQAYISSSNFNPIMIMQILIMILSVAILKKGASVIMDSDRYRMLIMIYWFSTLILILLPGYSTVAGRLSTLPATTEIILVPTILYAIIPKYLRTLSIIMASGFIFYLVFVLSGTFVNYIPYHSVLGGF